MSPSFSLVSFTISWSFLLGKMCITFHLYRNSDILLYLFKTNRVLWDWIIHGPPNIPVKCGMFHLYLFPVADTWRSSEASDSQVILSDGASVQTPFVDPKNLWPYLIVTFPLSVFNNCTVLLNVASSVMIKWWLSSSVPFPCRRYCLTSEARVNTVHRVSPALLSDLWHTSLFWTCIRDHGG